MNQCYDINQTPHLIYIGPIPPVLPINIEAVHIEYNSTIIQWTTTEITYTPESYYIKYGTSSNNLLLQSATLKGSDNLSTTDQEFEIKLTSLDHNTVYYYSVVSENQHETVESEIMSFQTPKLGEFNYWSVTLLVKIVGKSITIILSLAPLSGYKTITIVLSPAPRLLREWQFYYYHLVPAPCSSV